MFSLSQKMLIRLSRFSNALQFNNLTLALWNQRGIAMALWLERAGAIKTSAARTPKGASAERCVLGRRLITPCSVRRRNW
jgi:hypothetical protein